MSNGHLWIGATPQRHPHSWTPALQQGELFIIKSWRTHNSQAAVSERKQQEIVGSSLIVLSLIPCETLSVTQETPPLIWMEELLQEGIQSPMDYWKCLRYNFPFVHTEETKVNQQQMRTCSWEILESAGGTPDGCTHTHTPTPLLLLEGASSPRWPKTKKKGGGPGTAGL